MKFGTLRKLCIALVRYVAAVEAIIVRLLLIQLSNNMNFVAMRCGSPIL